MHHTSKKAQMKAMAESKQREFMINYLDKLSQKVAQDEEQLSLHQLQHRVYTIGVMAYRMLNGKGFPEDMDNPSLSTPSVIAMG